MSNSIRYADSLNRALHSLMEEDAKVFLIGEDILDPYGGAFKVSRGLSTRFPDRVIAMPISEAGFTGFATGMALQGLKPVVEIMFADFLTLCADQIINHAAQFQWMYNRPDMEIPLVIRTPSGGSRGYGPTHSQAMESLFFSTPAFPILAPSLYHDPGALLYRTVKTAQSPVLFVENKTAYSKHLLAADTVTPADTAILTMNNDSRLDAVIIAYGGMAPVAVAAGRRLWEEEEINTAILIPAQIKPVPVLDFSSSIRDCGRVLIVEENPTSHGWGAETGFLIQQHFFASLAAPVMRIGRPGHPIPSALHLEKQVLPSPDRVIEAVIKMYNC